MFSIILPTGLIDLLVVDAAVKKHRFPKDGKNATSPVLNSVRALSIPTVIGNAYDIFSKPGDFTYPAICAQRMSFYKWKQVVNFHDYILQGILNGYGSSLQRGKM